MEAVDPQALFSYHLHLPQLIEAELMPAMYEDSTHQLWRCHTADGPMVLKLCNRQDVEASPTWQVMQSLFALSLPDELAQAGNIRQIINHQGLFLIPAVVSADAETERFPAYVLSRFAEGQTLTADALTDAMVSEFARHIGGIHTQSQSHWGRLYQADQNAKAWPETLMKTFLRFSRQLPIGEPWLYKVMEQIEQVTPEQFCPIMLDNRWDQYLHNGGRITSLIDLDAFVVGPPELELVLLEYQLTQQQADRFARIYQQYQPLPELSRVRECYRLLLFLMNALGETDLNKWMQAPTRW